MTPGIVTDRDGNRFHADGHRVYTSAGPDNTFSTRCVVPGCRWPDEPEPDTERPAA